MKIATKSKGVDEKDLFGVEQKKFVKFSPPRTQL